MNRQQEDAVGVKIRCFATGEVREKAGERGASRYILDRWRGDTLPVNVFLVEHPGGLLLFDTGQTARATERGYLPRWHPFLRLSRFELTPEDEAAAQLRQAGIELSDVRWVVLSHLHNDHMGGLEPFAAAEVFVSRVEWERSVGLRGRLRGYLPQHWPPELVPSLLSLDGPAIGPFQGSHDIVGDERLVVVAAPGHTCGHVALFARGERSFLLGGDLAHDFGELKRAAPAVARWCRDEGVVFLATHDARAPTLLGSTR